MADKYGKSETINHWLTHWLTDPFSSSVISRLFLLGLHPVQGRHSIKTSTCQHRCVDTLPNQGMCLSTVVCIFCSSFELGQMKRNTQTHSSEAITVWIPNNQEGYIYFCLNTVGVSWVKKLDNTHGLYSASIQKAQTWQFLSGQINTIIIH